MVRKTILPVIIVAALGVIAAFGVFGYRAVYAQAVTPTATAPAQSGQSGTTGQSGGQTAQAPNPGAPFDMHGGANRVGGGQASEADLASALGITTDKLTAAYQAANAEALKQAVAKGLITQAQADQITANQKSGVGMPLHFGNLTANGIDYNALLAQALGITTDKLTAAQTSAFNTALDTAVKNGTMTQAQADLAKARRALQNDSKFQTSLKTAYSDAVKQAVTDGVISQAQADAILQAQTQQPGGFFGGFGPGFGGRGHGRGGPGGFLPPTNNGTSSNNGSSTNPAAPQATPNNSGL